MDSSMPKDAALVTSIHYWRFV